LAIYGLWGMTHSVSAICELFVALATAELAKKKMELAYAHTAGNDGIARQALHWTLQDH